VLANDAAQMLKILEREGGELDAAGAKTGRTTAPVYLAECSSDRRDAREVLEADLLLRLDGLGVRR
jgi:hypothetical protein